MNRLSKIKRGMFIPRTDIIAKIDNRVVYKDIDAPFYHGKKDCIKFIKTVFYNRNIENPGKIVTVGITQQNNYAEFKFKI